MNRYDYFLFLNSFVPSISVTYWYPFSNSFVTSLRFVAVLTVNSSFSVGLLCVVSSCLSCLV